MNFFKSRRNPINLRIATLAEILEFPSDPKARIREVFERVCHAISVRETWFFGLALLESNGDYVWLKSDKELRHELKAHLNKDDPDQMVSVYFLVKYFPENVVEELVLPVTQNLFYLQLKEDVMNDRLSVSPEMAILLASLVVQAELGDLDEYDDFPDSKSWRRQAIERIKELDPILPDHITQSIQEMTVDNWYEEVFKSHQKHKGMTQEEARIEYIVQLAEKASNFGVTYFEVKLGRDVETAISHWIGITAIGINLYALEDKLEARFSWQWVEVDDLNYKGRCFYIWPSQRKDDKKPDEVTFYTESASNNQIILELCQANHDLFMQRRREDSIEVQQMKEAAREEKDRRQAERNNLLREREARRIADQDLTDAHEQLQYFRDALHRKTIDANNESKRSEMLMEKVKVQDEEIKLLQIQVSQKDIEIDEIKTTMARLSAENIELSRRNAALESFCVANQNGAPEHSPVMVHRQSPYQNYNELQSASSEHLESNSNSQEKLQLNYTLVKISQLNRESDRLSSVIPDQRKQFEETFNIVKQGLDDLKTTSDEY